MSCKTGIQQGDQLAPLLFSLGLQDAIEAIEHRNIGDTSAPVSSVKAVIHNRAGAFESHQELRYEGRVLQDAEYLLAQVQANCQLKLSVQTPPSAGTAPSPPPLMIISICHTSDGSLQIELPRNAGLRDLEAAIAHRTPLHPGDFRLRLSGQLIDSTVPRKEF